ncbi:MAG: SUMF1/EgtB/PvdO family nonheme iron enzyme [Candidatus Hydrogenedentes bacterium]|nr:SUMF1/EgtB/PvdO family nonheme iron enzyme [Candidatus Hydrogenedentota bacterium]
MPQNSAHDANADVAFKKGDRVADRYVIESQIGQGGMGVVYGAFDALVNEAIALKFMKPSMLKTQRGKALFIQEAQIARRLRHDNIVAVHDVSHTRDGILYLSMEFAAGQSLRSYLRTKRTERRFVSVRLSVHLILQVLEALAYAHRTVIHRDIKPENLMILSGERLKVLDFGLAHAIQEEFLDELKDEAAKSRKVVGTLAYAAPEQRLNKKIDQRADLYAVGLVFHELLTLRTPMDEPVTVEQVRDDVSPSLLAVYRRALQSEKEARFQSAREFHTALKEAYDKSYRQLANAIQVVTRKQTASTENMVLLEGGSFLMGNNEVREDAPEEEVYVGPFWMDKYPVTVAQYADFLEATGSPEPKYWRDPLQNGPDQPVTGVSWGEAQAYAAWAGKQLPTETQWEFAARGKENRKYPWGSLPPDSTLCNFGDYMGMPSIVTMHEAGKTPEGIHDLAGNVMEWTADPFASYTDLRRHPERLQQAPRKVVRGGCFSSVPEELGCTVRRGLFPEARNATVGFRCVIPVEG